jgi:hypothetical protein
MSHPTLLYRDWDWEDGINGEARAERAEAKLRRLGFTTLADEARNLRDRWTPPTGNRWMESVQRVARALLRVQPDAPWRLFLFACNWPGWPEEAFPSDWQVTP